MRLREVAAKLSQEQQKRIEELNVQLLDEIDFEDTTPYRESPDAWRTLIYEEICTNEKISQAKIDYRRIGEISEEKLFKKFIEEADKTANVILREMAGWQLWRLTKELFWDVISVKTSKREV